MSYEKKIKDLLGRLVSMSPEPPPFPEEITMAKHQTPRRRRSALVFAGAAALVTALAVPVILLTNDPIPVGVGSTTSTSISDSSTSAPTTSLATTSSVPSSTTTMPTATVWTGVVFLHQIPANSFLSNPALVPVSLEVTDPTGTLTPESWFTDALASMGENSPAPYESSIPADVRIVDLTVGLDVDGSDVWIADMSPSFADGSGGLLADVTMLNQLVYTITNESGLDKVLFTIDGSPVTQYGSEGIVLDGAVDRDDYLSELAPIFLTEAVIEVEHVYVVAGLANTFEGTVNVRVLDGDGEGDEIVHEEFTTATCGTGCWGTFGVGIDTDLIEPGNTSIQILSYSARDGAPQDIVTIHIPADNVWRVQLDR